MKKNCLVLFLLSCGIYQASAQVVQSPDGHISLNFQVNDKGEMLYQVDVNKKAFIAPSELGLTGKNGVNLSDKFRVKEYKYDSVNENWTMPWGGKQAAQQPLQ